MAAILVLGSLLELAILAQRALRAYQIAERHSLEASAWRDFLDPSSLYYVGKMSDPRSQGLLFLNNWYRKLARYHEQMSEKYYDIARHPWRPALPDPAEPKIASIEDVYELLSLPQDKPGATGEAVSADSLEREKR